MKSRPVFEAIVTPKPITLIVGCIDPRFEAAMDQFPFKILGLHKREFIFIKIGGGPTPLAHPAETKSRCKALTKQLVFTCGKFPIQEVILISHEDCAYYTQLPCPCHGQDKEKRDLPLAGSLTQNALPDQTVKLFHANFINDKKNIWFEEIQVSAEQRVPPREWINCHSQPQLQLV